MAGPGQQGSLVPRGGGGEVRSPRLLLAGILLVAAALRLVSFGDPWSGLAHDFHNHFGAFATGGQAMRFLTDGIVELDGMLTSWRVVLPDGGEVAERYTHHPPLFIYLEAWSLALFGHVEWALRLVPALFSMLSVVGAWRLGRLVWGERAGLLMAAILAVVPWSAWYGVQTFSEGALIWIACEQLRRYVLWLRTGAARHLWTAAAWQFLAGLMDWPGGFLLLGLGFHGLLVATRTRGLRGLLSLLVLPAAFLAAVAVHWLHMGAVVGSEGRGHDTATTIATVTTLTTDLGNFLFIQLRNVPRWLGAGLAVFFALGLVRALLLGVRRRLSAEDWLWPAMLVPGILYVALFPQRSVNHDFFFMLALPGMAVLASGLLLAVTDRLAARSELLGGRGRWIGSALVVLLLASAAWKTVDVWRGKRSDQIEVLVGTPWVADLIGEPEHVVLTHIGRGMSLPFYSRAQLVHSVNRPDRLAWLEHSLLEPIRAKDPDRRVSFLFDLAPADKLAGGTVSKLLTSAGLPDAAGPERARAVEDLYRGLDPQVRAGLVTGLLTPDLAAVHATVTGRYPSEVHVVEGVGLFEVVDLMGESGKGAD